MKLSKVVLSLAFAALIASSALADVTCVSGIGYTDECGLYHCSYTASSGNCLLCCDSIDVKG